MKKFKKLLAVLLLVLVIGGLTACSQMNKVTKYFEEQGYVRYTYNNSDGSLLFRLHDDLYREEALRLNVNINTTTTETTTTQEVTTVEGTSTGEVVTTATPVNSRDYLGFISYAFSNDTYAVVVMEFESEKFLQERLAESAVLQAFFEGQDQADYVNGNCLLVVLSDYMADYDYFVDVFQGRLEPLEITTVTEVVTTTAENQN